MIRRDYIIRMIEQFMQVLSRIAALKKGQQWQQVSATVDEEFNRLVGLGAAGVSGLSETELLARLMQGEPTQSVRFKTQLLVSLLKEAGDLAAARGCAEESRSCYLKALHLLMHSLAGAEPEECPEFVPTVDLLVSCLRDGPLPLASNALLMQHYERIGEFAKAEDALFEMLEAEPTNSRLLEFGISFYQRLEERSDAALNDGNLPRSEVESGLAQLRSRAAATPS